MNKVEELMKMNRRMIESEWFKERHRKTKEAFSRTRKLSFEIYINGIHNTEEREKFAIKTE